MTITVVPSGIIAATALVLPPPWLVWMLKSVIRRMGSVSARRINPIFATAYVSAAYANATLTAIAMTESRVRTMFVTSEPANVSFRPITICLAMTMIVVRREIIAATAFAPLHSSAVSTSRLVTL